MRTLLCLLLIAAGCGKGAITIISCASRACDVTDGKVCCVTSTDATCVAACTGAARFNCLGPTTCVGGVCCVDDLGAHCVQSCNPTQKPACEKNADCAPGVTCGTKVYASMSGASLFTIGLCGGP